MTEGTYSVHDMHSKQIPQNKIYFPDTNQLTELKFPMTNNGDDDTDNQVVFTLLENEILPSELQT